MKKWDRKKFQRIMNGNFEDPFVLLLLNFRLELEDGVFVSERLDDGPRDVDEDAFEVRAYLIFGDVQRKDGFAFMSSGFSEEEKPAVELELRAVIDGLPAPGVSHDFAATKAIDEVQCWAYAAVTYSYDEAGRRLTHLHRHPLLDRAQAVALLKECQRRMLKEKAAKAGSHEPN